MFFKKREPFTVQVMKILICSIHILFHLFPPKHDLFINNWSEHFVASCLLCKKSILINFKLKGT